MMLTISPWVLDVGAVIMNYGTTAASGYTGTSGFSTTYSPKISKQKLTCCKCKTLIAEVYSFPVGDVTCKPCHQLDKLRE